MKHFALLLIPHAALAADFSPFHDKHSCPNIGNSHQCARSIEGALKLPYVARPGNQGLQVTLESGRIVTLTDGSAEAGQLYSALEAIADNRYVVLHRQFPEGSSYSLLDRTTGKVTDLLGYPLFSPDLRWVVVAQLDVGAGYVPNALQIYRHSDGALSLSYDANPGRWGPAQPEWKSPTQLSYIRATSECYIEKRQACSAILLTLGEEGWH